MLKQIILAIGATATLAGCAIPTGPVEVTRFNRASDGVVYGTGSYNVVPAGGAKADNVLALSPYFTAVAREMQRAGYSEQLNSSDVVAEVSVNVQEIERERRSPVSVGVGGSTGSYGSGIGLGVGINLNDLAQGKSIETTLSVRILRRADNLVIWEGRAVQSAGSKSPAAQAGIAASKLAEALFKDFPGESGKTITIP
jgi:Domain of unknown function (DUF4136)